jgi:hypothetical protein
VRAAARHAHEPTVEAEQPVELDVLEQRRALPN